MKATAVIDCGFGNGGKGLVTDHLAAKNQGCVVVRFNGGAQAGHTVVTPDGIRHVFCHYGSGSLAGSSTYLSKHFIVNPYLWEKEHKLLSALAPSVGTINTMMMVNPLAMLTTPYDMLVNQEVERSRGRKRHGSCGVGINETANRCLGSLGTFAQHLANLNVLEEVLWKIQKHVVKRMKHQQIVPSQEFLDRLDAIDPMTFVAACERMSKSVFLTDTRTALVGEKSLIFEGAQGLLLDEKHTFFPHVTRSRTGLTNVAEIAAEINLKDIEVVYVTRSYMTRHGAGPFPSEDKTMRFEDATNAPNKWQGSLRFGTLDTDLIAEAINKDLAGCPLTVHPCLAVTCLDQRQIDAEKIAHSDGLRMRLGYTSCGPTRNYVQAI